MSPIEQDELRVRGHARPLSGDVQVPGDKSIGHRAVMFNAIAEGRAVVRGLSGGEDNRRTIAALRGLGVAIEERSPTEVAITGQGLGALRASVMPLDCGNSGTSMRLLCGVLAARPFATSLTGDRYLHARPMRRIADPLARMGAQLRGEPGKKNDEIYPPLTVGPLSGSLRGIHYASPVASAQIKSAILLAALAADGATTVLEPARSRDHTERLLRHLEAPLTVDGLTVTLSPDGWNRRLRARDLLVPGDLSSAAFLLAAAAVVPRSRVTVRGVGLNPTRTGFVDALRAMGARLEIDDLHEVAGEPVGAVTCSGGALAGVTIAGDLAVRAIDELPLIAAVAAYAEGDTCIADAAELRVKESDRIAATCTMLRALGVTAEEQPDGLTIRGGRGVSAGVVDSHGDHRIAMAAAICALGANGETRIIDTANVATSFPSFARALASLGADLAA
jgi:3-phosphoshikimate 1-carboxyvinyltransferase